MYNLVALVEQMAANLDAAKKDNLLNVKMAASKVISLSSKATQRQPTLSALAPIPEGNGDDETQDDLGVFGADDIQALLRRMNYKINFILFEVCVITTSKNVILMSNTSCSFPSLPQWQMLLMNQRTDT